MNLPVNLSLPMVADVLADLGVLMDRGNVGRALQGVVIAGVEAPDGPGGRWRVPRRRLTDVVAACLYRRARRSPERWGASFENSRLLAGALMLDHAELWKLVPRSLAEEIVERHRAVEERQRREREAKEAAEREERARQEREAKARRLEHERREHERREKVVLDWCYSVCFSAAMDAVGAKGHLRKERPEEAQLLRDWPTPRPDWWAPPPGLREPMDEWLGDFINIPREHPDWNQWIPRYEPGRPWPWRRTEADAGDGDAGAPA